jgi:hypothetical protein
VAEQRFDAPDLGRLPAAGDERLPAEAPVSRTAHVAHRGRGVASGAQVMWKDDRAGRVQPSRGARRSLRTGRRVTGGDGRLPGWPNDD